MEDGLNCGDFHRLPEGCISHAVSFTSPRDACQSALVSKAFRSAAASDTVWECFLPHDYREIISRAVDPVGPFASKKELYFRLCEPLLIDGGKMIFSLEKGSGKKCYMLSARELVIVWGDTPHYWSWISSSDSRFSEVAELRNVCWLEIHGKIETKALSPGTTYAAYLVFKIHDGSHGLSIPAQETSVKVGAHVDKHIVRLRAVEAVPRRIRGMFRHVMPLHGALWFGPQPQEAEEVEDALGEVRAPQARNDGWMEIELGEFFNGSGDDGEVDMSLMEVKGGHWKSGLVVQGIELRPKN